MAKIINKMNISKAIYKKIGYSKVFAEDLTESILFIIKDNLKQGRNVKIHKFGNFIVKDKKERKGRNPQTGEPIIIPAHRTVKFQMSRVLRELFKRQK